MSFCTKCGKELIEGATYCGGCGAAVTAAEKAEPVEVEQVVAEQIIPAAPVEAADNAAMYAEEKECLDDYYKLLKWERISWSISGKVFLILGIIFVAMFGLIGLIAATEEPFVGVLMFVYVMIYGAIFFPFAIISLKMVGKVQYYMDTLYTDIRPTVKRCGSIGMIVFEYFFGSVSLVFFIINFVRTKCSKDVIARIVAHQQEGK